MRIYIQMFLIAMLIAIVLRKRKALAVFGAALPFFVIAALRYDVGTDYMYRYVPDYLRLYYGGRVGNLELGFKLLVKFCIFFFRKNFQVLFIITSFVIIAGIFYSIYRNSKNYIFSIALFFVAGYYFQSLNIVRQFMAMAILLAGYRLIIDKKYVKWVVVCLVASMIHTTAIIGVGLIVLNEMKEISIYKIVGFSFLAVVGNRFFRIILVKILSFTRFAVYVNSLYDVSKISITLILQNIIIYMYMYYSFKIRTDKKYYEEDKFLLNIQAATLLLVVLGSIISLFDRMVLYFQIFQLISIPNFISASKKKENAVVITFLSFTVYGFLFWRNFLVENQNEILPYITFFNRYN